MERAVLRRAQEEADGILGEAQRKADARYEAESRRLRGEHERRVAVSRAELEGDLDREAGTRESEDRRKLLQVKNEIMDSVFQQAADGIRSLPHDGYATWMREQFARVPRMSAARIAVNKQDRDLAARLLKAMSENAHLELSDKPAPIRGGFLVHGEKLDFDYSVDSLLGVVRESLAEETAKRLFGDEAA